MSAPASATIAGRRAHHLGVLAEELDRDRVLVGMQPQQLAQRALVAVVQAEARDHLRDREAGAVAARLQADEPVADPRQRREQHAVGDLDVADAERGLSAAAACTGVSHQLRSWISRRPRRVSSGSTSSIVSQCGAIVAASPPVAMKRRRLAELVGEAAVDPVDQAGEAVGEARTGSRRRCSCRSRRRGSRRRSAAASRCGRSAPRARSRRRGRSPRRGTRPRPRRRRSWSRCRSPP